MSTNEVISELVTASPNRRSLLRKLGLASAAAGVALTGASTELKAAATASGPSLADALQLTLNLEYLESEFYTISSTGKRIEDFGVPVTGQGTAGLTTGGNMVNFADNVVFTAASAAELAANERAHVLLLRSTLEQAGVTPVAKPEINLAANGTGFAHEVEFIIAARIFEELGASLAIGAIGVPTISSTSFVGTIAQIAGIESQHVGNLRLQIARLGIQISAIDGVDTVPPPAPNGTFFSGLANALAPARSPGQVLFHAYGNQANVTSGGFFPQGVNGVINMSSDPA